MPVNLTELCEFNAAYGGAMHCTVHESPKMSGEAYCAAVAACLPPKKATHASATPKAICGYCSISEQFHTITVWMEHQNKPSPLCAAVNQSYLAALLEHNGMTRLATLKLAEHAYAYPGDAETQRARLEREGNEQESAEEAAREAKVAIRHVLDAHYVSPAMPF